MQRYNLEEAASLLSFPKAVPRTREAVSLQEGERARVERPRPARVRTVDGDDRVRRKLFAAGQRRRRAGLAAAGGWRPSCGAGRLARVRAMTCRRLVASACFCNTLLGTWFLSRLRSAHLRRLMRTWMARRWTRRSTGA